MVLSHVFYRVFQNDLHEKRMDSCRETVRLLREEVSWITAQKNGVLLKKLFTMYDTMTCWVLKNSEFATKCLFKLKFCDNKKFTFCNIKIFWFCDNRKLSFCDIITFTFCEIKKLSFCDIREFSFCYIKNLTFCDIKIISFCDIKNLTFCDMRWLVFATLESLAFAKLKTSLLRH